MSDAPAPTPTSAITDLIASSAPAPQEAPSIPKVFIAVASGDWKSEVHTSESIRAICSQCKCETMVRYMFNDGVARSRNNLAAMFLETDCTHLFFLDSDIVIEPRQFQRLLDAKKRIIAAFYPKKQPVLDWVANYLPGEAPDENGYMKIRHAGTGALLLERQVILDDIAKNPDMLYRGDPSPEAVRHDIFPMRAVNGFYKSEDWAACERWIANGESIWVDTKSQLRHVGKIVYPLQFTLSDDELVDVVFHRYGMWPDHVKSFFASGGKPPGLMGGHRERFVRLWPTHYPVADLHQGGILQGAFEVPVAMKPSDPPPVVLDIGATYGAFTRFALKRWHGCEVTAYEGSDETFPFLEETVTGLVKADAKLKAKAVKLSVDGSNAALLPKATLLKIDLPNMEREILMALASVARLDEFDAVVVVYANDTEAFLVAKLMEATHLLHCWQRLPEGRGIVKFTHRRIEFGPHVPERKAS